MQNVKGTNDYFGQEQAVRKQVRNVLENTFERYDFEEMDSAILNELELLASKYAGGDEILKEMYQLTDQGKRSLGLRYDLTIPFAKVVALNPGIELPFKRYEIGKVFRDGPVKRGRLREFLQCDADVVGVAGPEAEAELMQLAAEAFRRLDIPVTLKWNNRRFLGEVLGAVGILPEFKNSVMLTLDKTAKIGSAEVGRELRGKGLDEATASELIALIELDEPTFGQVAGKYELLGAAGRARSRRASGPDPGAGTGRHLPIRSVPLARLVVLHRNGLRDLRRVRRLRVQLGRRRPVRCHHRRAGRRGGHPLSHGGPLVRDGIHHGDAARAQSDAGDAVRHGHPDR